MLVSELIELLKQQKEKVGDKNVYISSFEEYGYVSSFDIDRVYSDIADKIFIRTK